MGPVHLMTQSSGGDIGFMCDSVGRRTGLNYPNGLQSTFSYDADSNLGSLTLQNATASTITFTSYTYDNAGNRISATTTPGGYNVMNNLSQGQYSYDSGNRLTDDGIFAYSYNNTGNRITRTEKATGNTTNYTWDAENRLIQVQMPSGSIVQYEYDPFGRRIEKNVNGTITQYLYDNQNILFDYDQNGNVQRAYTHGAGIDEPLMITSSGNIYYYHANALGSISMISNSSGTVIQTNVYDAFGSIQSGNTLSQPYAFTGREYDSETGLYYYRARYYDPLIGRFISKDPIGFAGGINKYVYVGNSPVTYIDPLGLLNLIGGVGGTLVGVTGAEGSVGVVVNTNGGLNNIGFTGSAGIGGGLNVSSDVYAGFVTGNISNVSGQTLNINLVAGPVSVTVFTDKNGNVIGGTVGLGPGVPAGASGTYSNTGVLTLQNIWDFITGKPKPKLQTAPCH